MTYSVVPIRRSVCPVSLTGHVVPVVIKQLTLVQYIDGRVRQTLQSEIHSPYKGNGYFIYICFYL